MNTIIRPIAVRAYTEAADSEEKSSRRRRRRADWPEYVLIFDTETTTDPTQRLLFGSYRICKWESGDLKTKEIGIFHADDLDEFDPEGYGILKKFVRNTELLIWSRRDFVESVFGKTALQGKSLIVGFNLPFDLSRLAVDVGSALGHYYGGFSFIFWNWIDHDRGEWLENRYRPRLCVKSLDSKRAFIGFRHADQNKFYRGHFLDLRSLIFALTNRGHSLESACEEFGIEGGKDEVEAHGQITEEYVRYNLRDVDLTKQLLVRLRAEFDEHPLHLSSTKAYSPASIAKAYLQEMGLQPPLKKFTSVSEEFLGQAMAGYFGGRAEIRIRRTSVPVVYVDFLSMYPTVNCLLGIWDYLIAEDLEVVDATDEVREILGEIELDECFEPERWRDFVFFAEIEPDTDIVPVRTRYDLAGQNRNIGVNPLSSEGRFWFAGPDLIASKILTGEAPEVVHAWKLIPRGTQDRLTPIRLRGRVEVDPTEVDFFRAVIEERKSLDQRDLDPGETKRLDLFLKVLANSGSYGVYAEFNRQEVPESNPETIRVHGQGDSFLHDTSRPELPGKLCYPPLAACTTVAARLMLAMLERSVRDLGGSYAFCDTDSMAIVAREDGGLVECPGGDRETEDGAEAIEALTWNDVRNLCEKFQNLSPYDPERIGPHSVLEIEDENFRDGAQRQLHVYAISAKRYVLYEIEDGGEIRIVKFSEHGLGHLLDPTDPGFEDVDWIEEIWQYLLGRKLGLEVSEPEWLDLPAISRTTISSPHLYRPFRQAQDESIPYRNRIKPYNFLLSAHVAPMGHPVDADPTKFHLIAPYSSDPSEWLGLPWTDVHSEEACPVTVRGPTAPGTAAHACLKTYRDVVEEYARHPEPKGGDPEGGICTVQTEGLLQRLHVRARGLQYIGKESNELEAVEKGMVHDIEEVQAEYGIGREDLWKEFVVPALKEIPARVLARKTGHSERYIKMLRNGHRDPSSHTRMLLQDLALRYREGSLRWD